ncbi:MAG: outer membrane beta-barrel family protein [Flavihumibacter sp.]
MIYIKALLFASLLHCCCYGQPVSGHVYGGQQQALENASVELWKDSVLLTAGATGKNGHWQLQAALQKMVLYRLHITRTGYNSCEIPFLYNGSLPAFKVTLTAAPKTLSAVTVTAKPSLLSRKTDRYSINVENGPFASGLSAAELLQRSPGVWVDNQGPVRLRGTGSVTIMVNNVVQKLSDEELADFLGSLKAEDISRIEIIPVPPAAFEAAGTGGIIHIILKKKKTTGRNGNLNTQYSQQGPAPYYTTGATLNQQSRRLFLSGSYTYTKDLHLIKEETVTGAGPQPVYENRTTRDEKVGRQQARFTGVYDINPKQSVSLQALYARFVFRQDYYSDELYHGNPPANGQAYTFKNRTSGNAGATLNYTLRLDTAGSTVKLIADYSQQQKTEHNRFIRTNSDPAREGVWGTSLPADTRSFTVQADLLQQLRKKTVMTAGVKYASDYRTSLLLADHFMDASWLFNPAQSNHFVYRENILMAYSQGERTIRNTTVKAGLRAEETITTGRLVTDSTQFARTYFGLFPSLSLAHILNAGKDRMITFSYARRLTRPEIAQLNPARLQSSSYISLRGNPALQPAYSQHFSLAWQFARDQTIETYFTRTSNDIAVSANTNSDNTVEYIFENTGSSNEYGLQYSSVLTLQKWWTANSNVYVYHLQYRFNEKPYQQTSFYLQLLHTFSFNKKGDIDFTAYYQSPFIYTNLYTYGNFSMDLGYTKKLFKTKLRMRLAVTDLLNTSHEREWTDDKGFTIAFYRKRASRTARVSLSYQFSSGKKFQLKNVENNGIED